LEKLHPYRRLDLAPAGRHGRGRLRHLQPGSDLGGRDGPRAAEGELRRPDHVLGCRDRDAEHAAVRDARRGARDGEGADADLRTRRRLRLHDDPQPPVPRPGGEHRRALRGRERVPELSPELEERRMALLDELREAVIAGQAKAAVAKTTEGLADGVPAGTLLQDGLITAMRQVGELYEQGEFYVPEMLIAAHAMTEALAVL